MQHINTYDAIQVMLILIAGKSQLEETDVAQSISAQATDLGIAIPTMSYTVNIQFSIAIPTY